MRKPAAVKLFVDGKQTAAVRVERTVPVAYSAEGLDIGMDNISPVSPDYLSPFAFGEEILSVTIAVQSPSRIASAQRSWLAENA